MHVISNTKKNLRFWLCQYLLFCWKNPGGSTSIRGNGKLTGHVCFVNQAFDGIGEAPCAEHHESNSKSSVI